MRNIIGEDIISTVRNLKYTRMVDIQKEIQVSEPVFDKWAKNSTKEEVNQIRYSGVVFQGQETAKRVGGIILTAKIEGFLMAMIAQDRAWCDKLFIRKDNKTEDSYQIPVSAFLEGKLEPEIYEKLKKTMSDKEKKDPNNWKTKTIIAFENKKKQNESMKKAKGFLQKSRRRSDDGPKNSGISDGDITVSP